MIQEQPSIEKYVNYAPIEKEKKFSSEVLSNNVDLEKEPANPIAIPEATTSNLINENNVENNFMAAEDVDDTEELPGDGYFIAEEKKIIEKYSKKPFNEDIDLEELQKKYLKNRFDVHVGLDKEKR